MAYLNKKITCFSPELNIEQTTAKFQEKVIDDISDGDIVITPDAGYDGLSKITVAGIYYNDIGFFYSKVLKIKYDYGDLLDKSDFLEKVIFSDSAGGYLICDLKNCQKLKTVIFDDGCDASTQVLNNWLINSPVDTMIFKTVSNDFYFDMWSNFTENLTSLENLEVCSGWDRDLAFYNSPLTRASLLGVINNIATVTDGQTLWFGDDNLAKLSQDEIDIAINKGWDIF